MSPGSPAKGDVLALAQYTYTVLAVKPYPNAKNPVTNNVLLARPDGSCKHWIGEYAMGAYTRKA